MLYTTNLQIPKIQCYFCMFESAEEFLYNIQYWASNKFTEATGIT